MAGGDSGSAGRAFTQYTMTAFTNSSESKMFVYDSTDGANFRPVGGGHAYSPPAGLVRDPSMMRHLDGWYYLVYTTGWDGNTIGFARSRDRVHWDFLRNFTMPIRGAAHTWAPVWFLDDGRVSFIVSVSTGGPFLPYLFTATDPALTNWTAPTQLLGIGPNYIDTIVIRTGAIYHAFTKNETTKFVEHAVGPTAVGPFLFVGLGNWAGWGAPREGQSIIHLDNGGWRIFLDGYTIGKYFYSDSHDGFLTWSPPRELPGLSGHVRHFTVLKELARR
ncbi:MAG: family 43 glycosylhydrolase [Mycobacteriaceae bacterium]|nr:family 43 glycosylhydrolase [Mycobacteriaceae bacterium]